MRARGRAFAAVLAVAACAAPAPTDRFADTGVTLAQNVGSVLVILSLDPARPGRNEVRVELRNPPNPPPSGDVRLALKKGGVERAATTLGQPFRPWPLTPEPVRAGTLAVPEPGAYELGVDVPGRGAASFTLDLPAEPPTPDLVERVERAMNELRSVRESQTLTSGVVTFAFTYTEVAPDRLKISWMTQDGRVHDTVIVGSRRFDRDAGSAWLETDLGTPQRVPAFSYGDARRARVIGRDRVDGTDAIVLAFVDARSATEIYYRLWVGVSDLRVRRYVMMAIGHYMTGSFADFDAPLEVPLPHGAVP